MALPKQQVIRFCVAILLASSLYANAQAATLTGTVTNRTKLKPAAGDDVVLIRLAQGMQEAARTRTDVRGRFSLDVPDDGLHLIRVTHDKANYFRPVQPGTKVVDVDVFDAAAHIRGISAEADVMRVQTDESGKALRILENFFVKNDSDPPMTQFSDRTFEFFLPAGAVIEASAALSPGGMPVQASPVPLGDANHFAFIFPIRPGETRFQITYHLPYNGSARLGPKPLLPTDTVAVIIPKSIRFQAQLSAPYNAIADEVNAQTYVARNVQPSQMLEFSVSGTGQLPRDTQAGNGNREIAGNGASPGAQTEAASSEGAPDQTKFGGGLNNPVDPNATNDPWAKYRWWILGGLGLLMATGAGVLLRKQPTAGDQPGLNASPGGVGSPPVPRTESVFAVVKEELFQLESERLLGRVTEDDYREEKSALEVVLRRALRRQGIAALPARAPEVSTFSPSAKA